MRKCFLLLLICIILYIVISPQFRVSIPDNVFRIIDFSKPTNKLARDIIFNSEYNKVSTSELSISDIKNKIRAYFVDLNGDNIDDIICVSPNFYYKTNQYFISFFVSKDGEYKNIGGLIEYELPENIYVLKTKTDGYRDIIMFRIQNNEQHEFLFKYDSKYKIYNFTNTELNSEKRFTQKRPIKFPRGTELYKISDKEDYDARKILYDYILKYLDINAKEALSQYNISENSSYAFSIDLDDDGIKEIVGIMFASCFSGTAGNQMFILQKQNNQYVDINSSISLQPDYRIYVLPNKTNKLKDIVVFGEQEGLPIHLKYNGSFYKGSLVEKSSTNNYINFNSILTEFLNK